MLWPLIRSAWSSSYNKGTQIIFLTLVLLSPDMHYFPNNEDPDQKPSDQDLHCLPVRL